ncbi:MAG: HAD family hydrolase [Candidatus Sericytochromatia bacterium]
MPVLSLPGATVEAELLVLDKDGVLVDFHHLWRAVTRTRAAALAAEAGSPGLAGQLATLLGLAEDGTVAPGGLLATGTRAEATIAAATGLHQAGLPWAAAREAALRAFAAADALDFEALCRPLPGAVAAVKALSRAGFKLAIATTDRTEGATRFLAQSGLTDCFAAVVGADRVARSKPAPDMFMLACAEAGVSPGRAVMIGDGVVDVQMGREAGAAASIGVLSGVGGAAALAEWAEIVLPDLGAIAAAI